MERARIDVSEDLDGEAVVHVCFELVAAELAASVHAVRTSARERFGMAELSADEVVELRELTALADELAAIGEVGDGDGARHGTVVLRPGRLSAFRHALEHFVESREDAEWLRDEDREPLALARELLAPLERLCAEAMRAALSPGSPADSR